MSQQQTALDRIKLEILASNAYRQIEAIGVFGLNGYEGAWNDIPSDGLFDVFVVSRTRRLSEAEALEKTLRTMTGNPTLQIRWFSIRNFLGNLGKVEVRKSLYDILGHSWLLQASDEFRKKISAAKSRKRTVLSKCAIEVLLENLWTITGPWESRNGEFVPRIGIDCAKQIRTAILAVVDAILIERGQYNSHLVAQKLRVFYSSPFYKTRQNEDMSMALRFLSEDVVEMRALYPMVLQLYADAMQFVLGKDLRSTWDYPFKKDLILPKRRQKIERNLRRYRLLRTLYDVVIAYQMPNEEVLNKQLSLVFQEGF